MTIGKVKKVQGIKYSFLYFDNRLCIPRSSVRLELIEEIHGIGLGGHFGREDNTTG